MSTNDDVALNWLATQLSCVAELVSCAWALDALQQQCGLTPEVLSARDQHRRVCRRVLDNLRSVLLGERSTIH